MKTVARRAAWRAVTVAVIAAALAWAIGGQAATSRIDPALLVPLVPLPMMLLAWWQRRETPRVQALTLALCLVAVLLVQAGLGWSLAGEVSGAQLLLSMTAALLAAVAVHLLLQSRTVAHRWRVPALLLFAAAWFALSHVLLDSLYRQPRASGPAATMISGLPLRFGGGTDARTILAEGMRDDPALTRLHALGPVRLVDSLADARLPADSPLLIVHPRALEPRELVAIDSHVRGGGRAIILADALSAWPPQHPLGDPRNAPITSLLTPLLDHWGVRLAAADESESDPVDVEADGMRIRFLLAGRIEAAASSCRPIADRRVAFCRIGEGTAWLVGDADLLLAPLWEPLVGEAVHLRRADTLEWLAGRLWNGPAALLQPQWTGPRG